MERIYCHVVAPVWTMRHPDMAAGWLTAYVRHNGWQAELLDLNAELYWLETRAEVKDCWPRLYVSMNPEQFTHAVLGAHGDHVRQRLRQVADRGCRVFGLLITTGNARFVADLSRMIKEVVPESVVVVGGPGVTSLFRYRRYYRRREPLMPHSVERDLSSGHAIDYWVLGEGELTLMELLQQLERGETPGDSPGLARTGPEMFLDFKERPLIKDLDSLPLVDFEGFDLSRYDYQALPFQLSRGCAFARCSHCGLKGYSRGFRVRSPNHAMAEIRANIARHGIREFHFVDLGVNGDLELLGGFCDAVIAAGLQMRWECFFQIRPDMTFDLLRRVVDSGCYGFNYGFETGSDLVLQTMRKPYSSEDAARVLRMTRKAGGRTCINVMVGHPGETEQEFQQTLDFLSRNVEGISIVGGAAITEMQLHSPLLEECDHFGIQMVGTERNNWQTVDGSIDWRVRNDRIHRLTEHLRTLGIPCFEAYWDPLPRGFPPPDPPDLTDDAVQITGIVVTAPDVEPEQPCKVDMPLLIHVGYRATSALKMAVFDLQISDLSGQVVFTTPSPTQRLRAVEVYPQGWVRMALGPYDLPPGRYLVTATARSFHEPERVFDRYIDHTPFTMVGAPHQRVQVVTPYTWTHSAGHLAPASGSPLRQIRVYQGDDSRQPTLREGAGPPVVELRLAGEAISDARMELRLLRQGVELHHASSEIAFDARGRIWRYWMDGLTLTAGSYDLELALHTGSRVFESRHHLQVQPPETPGQVLLQVRPTWRLDPPLLEGGTAPGGGRPEQTIEPGDSLTVSLELEGLPVDQLAPVSCRVAIEDRQGCMLGLVTHRCVLMTHGTAAVDLELEVPVLDGEYTLRAGLWGEDERLLAPVRSVELRVKSQDRTTGGGLVYAPHRMTVSGRSSPS